MRVTEAIKVCHKRSGWRFIVYTHPSGSIITYFIIKKLQTHKVNATFSSVDKTKTKVVTLFYEKKNKRTFNVSIKLVGTYTKRTQIHPCTPPSAEDRYYVKTNGSHFNQYTLLYM